MLFKRGNIWWVELNGKRISTKCRDEDAARKVYNAMKVETTFGIQPSGEVRTLATAVERYLTEHSGKRSADSDKSKAEWWVAQLGQHPLRLITGARIRDAIEVKRAKDGISNATANRYLAFIRTVLRCCEIDWGWLESAPKLRTYPEDNRRESFLDHDQIKRLLAELPDHLRDMVLFSLTTGLRQSNVTGLRWDWIDMDKRLLSVPSSSYKSKRVHTIPLSDTAVAVLGRQQRHGEYVFTYKGQRMRWVNNHGWRNAVLRAGLDGFRWHDLRHTFASHHAMSGTPLQALQELGGWKSASVLQRYAHLSRDHLRQYGSNSPV